MKNDKSESTDPQGAGSKQWPSRDYRPHYDDPNLFKMLTIRLVDSMPQEEVAWLLRHTTMQSATKKRAAMEEMLDSAYGECHLRDERVAAVAQDCLLHFDGERYNLLAWVVMPNHLHVLAQFRAEYPVTQVMHSWKSFIANKANKLLGRSGPFWQRECYFRTIKNKDLCNNAVRYIEGNPVKTGLVAEPGHWKFSSAMLRKL